MRLELVRPAAEVSMDGEDDGTGDSFGRASGLRPYFFTLPAVPGSKFSIGRAEGADMMLSARHEQHVFCDVARRLHSDVTAVAWMLIVSCIFALRRNPYTGCGARGAS